jgi:hypothetical protein
MAECSAQILFQIGLPSTLSDAGRTYPQRVCTPKLLVIWSHRCSSWMAASELPFDNRMGAIPPQNKTRLYFRFIPVVARFTRSPTTFEQSVGDGISSTIKLDNASEASTSVTVPCAIAPAMADRQFSISKQGWHDAIRLPQ